MTEEKNEQNEQNEQTRTGSEKAETHKESMIPKSRFDQVNAQKKAAELELSTVADALAEEVPEEYRDMIPELAPAAKIKWLRAANQRGLFTKASPDAPDTKRPNTQKTQDFSNMSPQGMMALGYGKK